MNHTRSALSAKCSETLEDVPPAFGRLSRVAVRRHPEWVIRFLPGAAPSHRWRAQTRRLLTRAEVAAGVRGALHAPTLAGLETQLRGHRLAAFLAAARGWRR